MRKFILIVTGFCLSACSDLAGSGPGNPDGTAYAGSADSAYSVAGNPPKTIGVVSYDPNAKQPAPLGVVATPEGDAVPGTLPAQDYGPTAPPHPGNR